MNDRERDQLRHDICRGIDAAILNADITIDQKCAAMTIAADAAIRALSGKERKGLVVGEDWEEFNYLCKEHVVIWDTSTLPVRCVREYCDYTEDAHACAQNLCPRLRGKVANQ